MSRVENESDRTPKIEGKRSNARADASRIVFDTLTVFTVSLPRAGITGGEEQEEEKEEEEEEGEEEGGSLPV